MYEYKSRTLSAAVEKANANHGGVVNDGDRYVIGAFMDWNELYSLVVPMHKEAAHTMIRQYKATPDVVKIIVQKGDQACAWHRREGGTWYRNVAQ